MCKDGKTGGPPKTNTCSGENGEQIYNTKCWFAFFSP